MSCLLYIMAWLNTVLSMGTYGIGFVVLFSYPYYFGIENPIEIILTPIGLVFVLEIDNWMFQFLKLWYKECKIIHLWSFKASFFQNSEIVFKKTFGFAGVILVFFAVVTVICAGTVIFDTHLDHVNNEVSSGLSKSAFLLGWLPFLLLIVMFTCCARLGGQTGGDKTGCVGYEIIYDGDSSKEEYDERRIMDNTRTLNIGSEIERYLEVVKRQKSKSHEYTSIEEEVSQQANINQHDEDLLNTTMNEVLRMESTTNDHDFDSK